MAGGTGPGAPLMDATVREYDAVLVVSFGGPEGPEEVIPFLENVTRGRGVPAARLQEVAEHYRHFGGKSPINAQNRALVSALSAELRVRGGSLPIYLGNRNWHPLLEATVLRMQADGVRRALALITSAFSSYSGCRQYREDVLRAAAAVGEGAPEFDRIRAFFDHPGFIAANAANLRATLKGRDAALEVIFTAHSIPQGMADRCAYAAQLAEAARLVAGAAGVSRWSIAYQSRSGPPEVPWLGPDVLDRIDQAARAGIAEVVVHPIGFLSDHVEVRYDLDVEAGERAAVRGLRFGRVPTVGVHPAFVAGLCDLIEERRTAGRERHHLGALGVSHDICPVDCCLPGRGR